MFGPGVGPTGLAFGGLRWQSTVLGQIPSQGRAQRKSELASTAQKAPAKQILYSRKAMLVVGRFWLGIDSLNFAWPKDSRPQDPCCPFDFDGCFLVQYSSYHTSFRLCTSFWR